MRIPLPELWLDCEKKELKDCPFCGNQPSISQAGHWAEVVISCNCHAIPQVLQRCIAVKNDDGKTFHYDYGRAKKEAIDIWNTRTAQNEKSVLVIDEEKMARIIYDAHVDWNVLAIGGGKHDTLIVFTQKRLSQNAKSYLRIVKDE